MDLNSHENMNQNDNIAIKTISLINISNLENQQNLNNNYLGKKRKILENSRNKIYKNKKLLSISKPIIYSIKSSNINNNENNNEQCIICLEDISFNTKHFLHCGHKFHCNCIINWINEGKTECPICRQNIFCPILNDNRINRINRNINSRNINLLFRCAIEFLFYFFYFFLLFYIFLVNFKYIKFLFVYAFIIGVIKGLLFDNH